MSLFNVLELNWSFWWFLYVSYLHLDVGGPCFFNGLTESLWTGVGRGGGGCVSLGLSGPQSSCWCGDSGSGITSIRGAMVIWFWTHAAVFHENSHSHPSSSGHHHHHRHHHHHHHHHHLLRDGILHDQACVRLSTCVRNPKRSSERQGLNICSGKNCGTH